MPQVESCRPELWPCDPAITLADMELEVIRAVLDTIEWYRRRVAKILGIGERTLYRRVRR